MKTSKYQKWYDQIINRAKDRAMVGYNEKHHIVPKSIGGSNDKSNLVELTAREHFICHLLLAKMTEGINKQKMTLAAWTMARTRKNIKISSRMYALLKEQASIILSSSQKGIKHGPFTEEHKQKIREASIKRYQNPEERKLASERSRSRGYKHSENTKMKMKLAKIGYNPKPPTMKGKKHSEQTKIKMKLAWVRRKNKTITR